MLQVLQPTPPTCSFEDCSSSTTDSCGFGPGVTASEYCDQLDIANFFLEMAVKRPFSLQDEASTLTLVNSNNDLKMRGGMSTAEMAPLPPTPQLTQVKSEPFSPPPPSDVEVYEKRPLPALPNKRHSGSSTLSKELDAAFATPHRSADFFEGDDDDAQPPPPPQQQQQQQQQQHPAGSAAQSDDMSWEETEIRVVLDPPIEGGDSIKPYLAPQTVGGTSDMPSRNSPSRQSEIHSPQPKLSMQKLFRLTGSGPKALNTSAPQAFVPPASSTPSGHNSGHKIKQLMGVDVAPRESSSSEFLRRARWSHQDDDVFASDQDIDISEGCFLDSEDESESEDLALAVPPTSAPIIVSREQSPIPAPLVINKAHLYDVDDPLVRPNSSAGERRLGLGSSHQHQYSSSSSLHYREDLYHRTASQLSRPNNNNNNHWRSSGSTTGISPPATRESHGSSSFGSGSQLIKPIDSEKPLPSPPSTASGRIPDTPATSTWSSSPGLPSGPSPASPEPSPSVTSHPQTRPRKRATSTGAFGNIGPQKWQNWQQHRQSQQQQQQPTSSPQKSKHPKVKIPYDPATDPHPGIRIILPYELEEEEFPVSSPTKSQHRASLVSNLLKRISGSPTSPYGQTHGHKKRPSEPTTPTWLVAGGNSLGLTRLDTLALSPTSNPRSPTSAAAATIPISGAAGAETGKQQTLPAPPSGQAVVPTIPPQTNKIITKVSGFSVQAENQTRQVQQIQAQPQNQVTAQHETPAVQSPRLPLPQPSPLAGNQRSSFSISEPPSPILSSLASLGHFNLSSGALGSFNLGNPFNSKDREDRARERERERSASRDGGGGSGRSMSSLGFRSPPRSTSNPFQGAGSQLSGKEGSGSGSGLRKTMADRSTLFAQKTGELVGLVGQVGKTTISKSVLLGKRLGSSGSNTGFEKEKDGPDTPGIAGFEKEDKDQIQEKETDKDKARKEKGEKWREDIKSKIRVLDDGGRLLYGPDFEAGSGSGTLAEAGTTTTTTSTNVLIPLGSPGLSPPERPERSPIVPDAEVGEFNQFRRTETLEPKVDTVTGTAGREEQGTGTKDTPTSSNTPQSPPPPPVPPRSKARPISGIGFNSQTSALASIGFGSTGGNGSASGSRPGSSRGIMRDGAQGGSRPGSSRANREGLGSRDAPVVMPHLGFSKFSAGNESPALILVLPDLTPNGPDLRNLVVVYIQAYPPSPNINYSTIGGA
ncbi:hypothetical protein QBC37DRAFT_367287 [Rhypophila decipiens]|uniref:Uncharacterized protein n=1 Tax=Rhypophila decipiens TaxID=261697 RepID=A0AAN6YKP3_9PEZI|nr:hypothetical protein QBC37DRAFT_367287 [Rhypophila decipiens]